MSKSSFRKGHIPWSKGKSLTEEHRNRISEALKGKSLSKAHRQKISKSHKGKILSEEHRWKIGINNGSHRPEVRRKLSEALKGRRHSEEVKRKLSKALKGRVSPMKGRTHSKKTKKKISEGNSGKVRSEEVKRKLSEILKGKYVGKNSSGWKGGISFLPYPPIFNNELKRFIKDRDNNECQNPHCDGNCKILGVHHVDHDKDNCSQFNLITLCISCNNKANTRCYLWKKLYKKIIWSKYE